MGCVGQWLFFMRLARYGLNHESTKCWKGTKVEFSLCPLFFCIRDFDGSIKIGLIFREEIASLRSQ